MRFRSKFAGRCNRCGGRIQMGAEIEWTKDHGASHVECWEKFLKEQKEARKEALEARIAEMNSNRAS